jgi:septal ring factor EnvC (AmiA/AmiB activator)
MSLNHEQRQTILAHIGNLEDDIYRCKNELGRGQSASEKASLAERIARAEDRIAKLKEGIND